MKKIRKGRRSLAEYKKIIGKRKIREIKALAKESKGKSVVHVNSTAYGGGVAEILHRLVPLMKDVGIKTSWYVLKGERKFFVATKTFHNALQGMNVHPTKKMRNIYLQNNATNARLFDEKTDFTIVHDHQPIPLIEKKRGEKWIWRCHIDLSKPNPKTLAFLKPFIKKYDSVIFTMPHYAMHNIGVKKKLIFHPCIDPLSEKNMALSQREISKILDSHGIDTDRLIISQISRFDFWKDPLGVIDAYEKIKRKIDCQLILAGSMAHDDPEGKIYFKKTKKCAENDKDIHLLTDCEDKTVNAIQRASNVVLQKSLREGFALTITEALWKGIPVIGRNVGGIAIQIKNGSDGYLVGSIKETAKKTLYLLRHPDIAKQMGKRGEAYVKKNFLITKKLENYLKLLSDFN